MSTIRDKKSLPRQRIIKSYGLPSRKCSDNSVVQKHVRWSKNLIEVNVFNKDVVSQKIVPQFCEKPKDASAKGILKTSMSSVRKDAPKLYRNYRRKPIKSQFDDTNSSSSIIKSRVRSQNRRIGNSKHLSKQRMLACFPYKFILK